MSIACMNGLDNGDLPCGHISIPALVKPAVGPIIGEMQKKMLTENKFFVFDILKTFMANFLYGAFNFGHDMISSTMNAEYKDFLPNDNTKIYELLLSFAFAAVAFRFCHEPMMNSLADFV